MFTLPSKHTEILRKIISHHGLIYSHIFTKMDKDNAFVSETFSDGKWSSTYIHHMSLQNIVKNISYDEFAIIISLAANALHNMNKSANTMQYKEAIEKEVESYTKAITAQNQQLLEKLV